MHDTRIISLPPPQVGHADIYMAFSLRRRETLAVFRDWLLTAPAQTSVEDEINSTVNALWGIATTISAAKPRKPAQ